MNTLQKKNRAALLVLLRAGLWEKEPDDLSLFPLSESDWKNVFRMARWQAVTGLVYRGVCRLPDALLPSEPVLLQWTVAVDRIERRNRRMNEVAEELHALWRTEGIVPLLKKGQGVALFYEQPLLRECGDIDWCFANEELERRALRMIQNHGVSARKSPDGSIYYRWKEVDIEHHTRLVDLYNPLACRYLKKLEQTEARSRVCLEPGEGEPIEVASPLLNLLLLDTHIMKHALGRGIGLRQLCDMARACYSLHGKVSAVMMKQLARKLGISKWNLLLHAFMVEQLGLPEVCLPYPEKGKSSEPLLEIVWKGGNFGMYPDGEKPVFRNKWAGKLHTLRAFGKNVRFSCRYAPKETFWVVMNLLAGQFRK